MPEAKNLLGMRFGSWTVIDTAPTHITDSGNRFTMWKCKCDCGTIKNVFTNSLINGRSTSCGCNHSRMAAETAKQTFTTHGESKTRLYKIWAGMRKRCRDKNAYNYYLYGGRGIDVCDDWNDFVTFKLWAEQSGYDDSLSIDRIDVNGNYEPDNCRWATRIEQSNNRRANRYISFNNETHTIAEWSCILNIPYKRLHKKITQGKSLEEILI